MTLVENDTEHRYAYPAIFSRNKRIEKIENCAILHIIVIIRLQFIHSLCIVNNYLRVFKI